MSLITRTAKGSKLTIEEMDGNLTTLDNQSFKDGVYTITSGSRTDSITALASGSIEVKSIIPSTGEVITEQLVSLASPTTFEDTILVEVYEDVQPTGGSGTGLTVNVTVSNLGEGPFIRFITTTNGGTGYSPGDKVYIATSELGADPSTESTEITLGIADISPTSQQRILMTPIGIFLPDLPTSDPEVAGQLWVDTEAGGRAIKQSAGE
jgi:hypothetical protein